MENQHAERVLSAGQNEEKKSQFNKSTVNNDNKLRATINGNTKRELFGLRFLFVN